MSVPASDSTSALARRTFGRILLVKPSSLGDIVHALPVLHGLRQRYPQARIDWLINRSCADLLDGHPDLNELVAFDRARFGRLGRHPGATLEFVSFIRGLRARRYDLAIDLQGLFRSGFLTFASGATVRLGFAEARELAWIFYTHPVRWSSASVHAADQNYRVAQLLGFADTPMTFDLALRPEERTRATALLEAVGLSSTDRFAAVLPGGRWETKRWLAERFTEVIDRLADEQGLPTVLMGAPDEQPLCTSIAERCRAPVANLAGQTGLRELAALLDRSTVVLCHDSAPMHLAAAQHRPMVCLLGPTNPARTGPYGAQATILQADLPCVPCHLRKTSQCRFDHNCMRELSVPQVTEAIGAVLQSGAPTTDK
ncbi:MAG: lipopolysaccharide heptosyltransferase II [bacterium]|nr:lipopolysaccharide heptosyltransferase II [bacterium]